MVPGQQAESVDQLQGRFAWELQDFVAESAFGWGQQRDVSLFPWEPS